MSPHNLHDPERRRRWRALIESLNPDIEPTALRLMDEMRLVSHALAQMGESSLAAAGLSYAQYRVLMGLFFAEQLDDREELNPSEISEQQGTSRNTISALIRSLEDEGLVQRHLDQADRRRFNISLTPAGRSLIRRHASRHMSAIGRCFEVLDPDEQEALSRLLVKLGAGIAAPRPPAPDPSP